jgi:hypothetical protein
MKQAVCQDDQLSFSFQRAAIPGGSTGKSDTVCHFGKHISGSNQKNLGNLGQ